MAYFGYNARQDSPKFQKAPGILAGAFTDYQFEGNLTATEPAAKYLPLNYMVIQNRSGVSARVTFPTGYFVDCITGQTLIVEKSDVQAYRSFRVTNLGAAAIVAGTLVITIQRKGTDSNDVAQAVSSRLGDWLGL